MSEEHDTPQDAKQAQDTVRKTGRGFLVITAAKLWFMVTGAVTQLGLPLFFGSAELFGQFKIITEAIGLLNMVMITGTLQAVAKVISEQPQQAKKLVNQALRLQLLLGVPVAVGYALASPWIAGELFHDASLTGLMRFSSLIIAFYAFYALFVGYLNGIKSFVRQAALDIGFQTMKTAGMLGLVLLGFGVGGAVAGFVGAAGAIALISGVMVWRMLRRGDHMHVTATAVATPGAEERSDGQSSDLLKFLLLVMAYTFALNGLLRVDLFMLKSMTSVPPPEVGWMTDQFSTISDKFAGFYGAALNLSRLPYQGVIAITFVVFPLISESTFQKDRERTKAYIETTFRYCLLLITAVALPLIFNTDSLIAALYSPDYRAVAGALAVMTVAIIFFSIFFVAATIITGAGRPGVTAVLMAISLGLSAALNWWFLRNHHVVTLESLKSKTPELVEISGGASSIVHQSIHNASETTAYAATYLLQAPDYMMAAAQATAIAMAAGCVLSLIWIYRQYSAMVPLKTVLRVLLAAAVLFGVDWVVPDPVTYVATLAMTGMKAKIVTLGAVAGKMAVLGLVFLLVLGVTGELSREDRARVMSVISRRKRTKS